MPIELEAKFRVDAHEDVRACLASAGATPLGRVLETNRIFDDQYRSLLSSGCGLRVRWSESAEGAGGGEATVTWKGPQAAGKLKSREEIEFTTGDASAAGALLERIGYRPVIVFQKRRESWRFHDCLVELDEVVHLGRFVEIEGPDEGAIAAVQQALGLASAVHVRESYVAMLVDYARSHGLELTGLTF